MSATVGEMSTTVGKFQGQCGKCLQQWENKIKFEYATARLLFSCNATSLKNGPWLFLEHYSREREVI